MTIEELDFNKLFPNEVFHQDNVWTLHHIFSGTVDHHYTYDMCLVGIIQDDPTELSVGISCCSPKDQYEKKLARNIAYARAYLTPVYFSLEPLINKYIDDIYSEWNTSDFEKDMYKYTRELVANGTLTFKDFRFSYLYQYMYPVYASPECYSQKLFDKCCRNIGKRDKEIIDFYNSLI